MPSYRSGEVILMTFPFTTGRGAKRRPTLILLDTGDADMIVAPITSRTARSEFDVTLAEWQQAGLALPSVARVHKPVTIAKQLVERRLGALDPDDWEQVRARILELWTTF